MCVVCGALNGHLTRVAAEAAHGSAQAGSNQNGDANYGVFSTPSSTAQAEAIAAGKKSLSGQALIDQITRMDLEWADTGSKAITYAFAATGGATFEQLNAAQIASVEKAMVAWSDVADISFERVGSGDSGAAAYSNNATILFNTMTSGPAYAYGYFPGDRDVKSLAGDIYFNTDGSGFDVVDVGSYDFMTMLHEVGHALGLSHPSVYNGGQSYSSNASYREDSREHTVMSYFSAESTGAQHGSNYAATPMIHDILAVQALYGANMSTRTGDTVYGFNSNAGESFSLTSSSDQAVFAVWDAGGNDTFDFSQYANDQTIDLRDGHSSDVGGLTRNVGIAFNAIIENAIGGSGKNIMIGNAAENILRGNGGKDVLTGGDGSDTLWGGAGKDRFVMDSFKGIDRIEDFSVPGDTIVLDNAVFSSLSREGKLKATFFKTVNSDHSSTDRNDFIVYNRKTGDVFYDADGNRGGADRIQIAEVDRGLALKSSDFFVI
jgi:serralysin